MSALDRWQRFWFTPVPAHGYALLRILFGAVGCATLIGLHDLAAFWSLDGIVPDEDGGLGLKAWLASHGLGVVGGQTLYFGSLVSFVGMTIGFRSGVTVPLSLAATLLQISWNSLPLSGAHVVVQAVLFCLIWADCGSVWSVDAWIERRRTGAVAPSPMYAIAPLRLIRFQIALVYLNTGLWKLYSPLWRDGSALHYVLSNNVFHRFPYSPPDSLSVLVTLTTYATLFWEITFPFMLLYGPTRRLALLVGVLMHLGMFVALEIGPFSLVMLAAYAAFLDPVVVPRLATHALRLVRRSPASVGQTVASES
jgi:uncharacterized membrane protein YphA (DoxX/SURF4 family)